MPEITYKFSRRRRSIGLTVTAEGQVVVAAPYGASQAQIARALATHKAWIARKVAARKEAWSRLQDGVAYYLGQPYRVTVAPGPAKGVTLVGEELRADLTGEGAPFWPLLKAWYRREANRLVAARVGLFAQAMGLKAGPIQVRDWKGRWGECHLEKGLRFNWRLILLPPEVLDYVVVHELAHLKVPGHPREFWHQVAKVLPDWALRRRWLNREGAPFLVWEPKF